MKNEMLHLKKLKICRFNNFGTCVSVMSFCEYLNKIGLCRYPRKLYFDITKNIFSNLSKNNNRSNITVPVITSPFDIWINWTWFSKKRFNKIIILEKLNDEKFNFLMEFMDRILECRNEVTLISEFEVFLKDVE